MGENTSLWNTKLKELTVGDYTKAAVLYPVIVTGLIMVPLVVIGKISEIRERREFEKQEKLDPVDP